METIILTTSQTVLLIGLAITFVAICFFSRNVNIEKKR